MLHYRLVYVIFFSLFFLCPSTLQPNDFLCIIFMIISLPLSFIAQRVFMVDCGVMQLTTCFCYSLCFWRDSNCLCVGKLSRDLTRSDYIFFHTWGFFLFIVPDFSHIRKLIFDCGFSTFHKSRRVFPSVLKRFCFILLLLLHVIITIIIKIIIKSKTRLVFSNVLIRMNLKESHNSSPVRVTTIKKRKAECFFFLFRISHRRHRKGRESVVREENGRSGSSSSSKLYIFTLTCFVWINNTTRKIFYITQNTKTSKFYFYYYWEKKMSCTESWSVIVGSIYNNETTY